MARMRARVLSISGWLNRNLRAYWPARPSSSRRRSWVSSASSMARWIIPIPVGTAARGRSGGLGGGADLGLSLGGERRGMRAGK